MRDTLRRLYYERILPREVADVFHRLRRLGNVATHEVKGTHAEALSGLKLARELGAWFHRTYAKQPSFKPGPFVPPPEPIDATVALKGEIAALRQKLSETESAAERARTQAEAEARTRETLEERLKREAQERALWEQLAQETEDAKLEIAARRASLQAQAAQAPKTEVADLVVRSEKAAQQIDLDEA